MTSININELIWDSFNKEHIKKHKVTITEAEETIVHIKAHRKGYGNRIILIGRSGKRIISIIVAKEKDKKYYIVTARDADTKERKIVYEKEKQNPRI